MSHFANDVHHRTTTRLRQIIPDFVESEYPQFVAFLEAYYEFLEQYDDLPMASSYVQQSGVVTIQTGNSTMSGSGTTFLSTLAAEQQVRVGADTFRVRTVDSDGVVTLYEVPTRTYYANTYTSETQKTIRQAKGALRQILTFHDVADTLEDMIVYFRNTYLQTVPQGITSTETLLPRILEFYQARGSEDAYRFLFRILYGKEIEIRYPRDNVFMLSDNQYDTPTVLKLDTLTLTGNALLMETRELIGLTSNARATVTRVTQGYEGASLVTTVFVDTVTPNATTGDILLNSDVSTDDGSRLMITALGKPPEGLETVLYDFVLVLEDTVGGGFIVGETVSTVPVNDPVRITGVVLGAVSGFSIDTGGANYQLGDLVFPPPGFDGGYGAVGKVTGFANTDITSVDIIDGGDGYYTGLSLIADNSGTGGSGLAGTVSTVTSGHLLLEDEDHLVFTEIPLGGSLTEYPASREKVDYYEVGISISDLMAGLRLDSDVLVDDGCAIQAEDASGLLQESAIAIDAVDWGAGNTLSAFYRINLSSVIVSLTSATSIFPIYVNGVRTPIGEVYTLNISSLGDGYTLGTPGVSVSTPVHPTTDVEGTTPLSNTYYTFTPAVLLANVALGQIGSLQVISAGAAYQASSNTFAVNSTTSVVGAGGTGAVLGLVLSAAVTATQGRFRDSRSMLSTDRYLQSVDRYQPFAYELTVEEDSTRYTDVVRRLLHPAGGLLLNRQSVTSELDMSVAAAATTIDLA